MNKISLLVLLYVTSLFSVDIPIEHAKLRSFGKSIELNSQIIQLSNAKQSVTSLVSGHLEKYFVEAGQSVESGQKIALIESILVSKMTADYISLKKQFISLNKNYEANQKLYDKGMLSMQDLNNLGIEKNSMDSKIAALRSQLQTLGIETNNLKKATGNFILYAHSSGKVSSLLQPLHTVVREDEAIISIIKDQAFYVQSYLPLKYASVIKSGQKLTVDYNGRKIVTHVTQILPELDVKTQRIVILSSIDEKADDLFVNTFVSSTLYFEPKDKHVAVKKSALSFFNNEWVVFIPTVEHEEEKHDDHEEHGEEKHDDHDDHEEESSVPYEARVVKVITEDDEHAGVQGINLDEEYVSDKSYYVKSMMLKSSLGEHGH
jgi:multidrug efflux pump subunit AcrA (membrane-fusion protein)